jgi:hypothetical protein
MRIGQELGVEEGCRRGSGCNPEVPGESVLIEASFDRCSEIAALPERQIRQKRCFITIEVNFNEKLDSQNC